MHDPDIRLDVNTLVFFHIYRNRAEGTGDDVLATLGEFHAGPLFPVRTRPADRL